MAAYFNLALDTTAPVVSSLLVNAGATYATSASATLSIALSDAVSAGYTMKVYGDVGEGVTESAASWEAYSATKSVTLKSGDGLKTVKVKVRDDVYNVSAEASATITLDTTAPAVTVTGPDVSKISEQSGKDACAFSFVSDAAFTQYKVKLVPSTSSLHTAGTAIPTAGSSTNMSGSGAFPASTAINCTVKGADLASAASDTDGTYIIKVFVLDEAGNWSV